MCRCPVPGVVVVKRINGTEFAVNKMERAWYGGNEFTTPASNKAAENRSVNCYSAMISPFAEHFSKYSSLVQMLVLAREQYLVQIPVSLLDAYL